VHRSGQFGFVCLYFGVLLLIATMAQMLTRAAAHVWQRETIPIVIKYVLAGGMATGVNFLVRIPLTAMFGFEIALIIAQAIGFTTGFILYRSLVFSEAGTTFTQQVAAFGSVNVLVAGVVIGSALVLNTILVNVGMLPFHAQMVAHAGGLAAGAPLNFTGHLLVTFRSKNLV
jgi:energy-coupling factor transport system substrate-specific component